MCLIGLRFDPAAGTLVVAANRDEFHHRPARNAQWWAGDRPLLAGKDLESGGTWLGVTRPGRFAVVTNVREMTGQAGPKSRGELPVDFLAGDFSAGRYAAGAIDKGQDYGGFNLLVFDGSELWWCSNRHAEPEQVPAGVHAVSNDRLNTPWPKVQRMIDVLSATVDGPTLSDASVAALLGALHDTSRPPGELPDTGVGARTEAFLAPVFIQGDQYGTRCSTVLSISPEVILFSETSFDAEGDATGRVNQQWRPGTGD